MKFKGRSIISIKDFSKEEILHIVATAKKFDEQPFTDLLKDKVMAALFFEPSTRTRLSFTSAMEQLGGKVIGFADPKTSSRKKGETFHDTYKMAEGYSDVIVARSPIEGSARLGAESVSVPVINAGDGANQHPTQTCLDLYTIMKAKGTLDGLNIAMVGDLKYGRTVHSLAVAMSHFKTKLYFIAPEALQMPKAYLDFLDKKGIPYVVEEDLSKVSKELDVLYMTRIQKERFPDPVEYEKLKGVYKLDASLLPNIKKDMIIMHPLPRVDEIHPCLDKTPHALYFQQAANGIPTRKALLALTLGAIE